MWWRKRVFDLSWALRAEELAPIPADHAVTVMAVLESGGVPVTAGAEAAEKIKELKGSVAVTEDDLRAVKKELDAAPDRTTLVIGKLRTELKKLIEATQETVLLRTGRVARVRSAITCWVSKLTSKMIERVWSAGYKRIDKLGAKFAARITAVEADMKAELASLRDSVSQLEAESFAVRFEIRKLEPIAEKWTLPVRK